jgi:peptide/nickel transport system permease protein
MKSNIAKAILTRLLSSLATLFLLVSFLFIIIRLSPGDPTDKYVSAKLGTELSNRVTEKFSLDQPIVDQYFSFISNIISGDMGVSYNFRQPVFEVIWEYFSFTLIFALISFFLQMFLSVGLALWITKKQNRNLSNFFSGLSIFIYSIPAFVLGVGLIYIFSVQLNLFPISGLKSLDYENLSFTSQFFDKLHHLILPLITLTAAGVALFYKYIKESMDEVLSKPFIINLQALGMDEKIIFRRHVLPNAMRPLISVAGIELGMLLGGVLITEIIFSLPGMGRLTVNSIFARDYPLVIGCVFTAGAVMILANFLADLVKLKIDKRLIKGILN